MLRSISQSTLSPALRFVSRRVAAIALIETLVAAAIMASTALAFLFVFADARTDIARAQRQTEAVALAQQLLAQARQTWNSGPSIGQNNGYAWSRRCAAVPNTSSPRLILIQCRVTVRLRATDTAHVALETMWATERPGLQAQ